MKPIQRAWLILIFAMIFLIFVRLAYPQVVPGPPVVAPNPATSVITGQLQTATGGAVTNGTLNFTLSQPSLVSGTSSLAANTVSCYTSTSGNVVGVPDPLVAPVLSANLVSGTLAGGTYYVKYVYVGPGGTTSVPSPEAQVILSSPGTLNVNAPAFQPAAATGFFAVYIGTTSGAESLQGTATSWTTFSQSTPLVAGAALPVANNTSCNIWFSDTLIPTGTSYTVSLVNKNGSLIAGFPQTWCTFGGAGGTINVSAGAPTGNCGTNGVFYPTPIFAVPANNAQQSINGPLSVAGPLNPIADQGLLGSASLRWNISSYTVSNTNPGVFTNTQMNEYLTSQLNSINLGTEFNATQSGNFATDALAGGLSMPSTATVHQGDAVSGYANTLCDSLSRTVCNTAAVYGQARALGNGSAVWGSNFLVQDAPGVTGAHLTALELDTNVIGTPTYVRSLLSEICIACVAGGPGTVPSTAIAYEINHVGSAQWPFGVFFTRGTFNNTAVVLDGLNSAAGTNSNRIAFRGYDGGNVVHEASINGDQNGNLILQPSAGAAYSIGNSGAGIGFPGSSSGSALLAAPATGGVTSTLPTVAGTLTTNIASGTATMTVALIGAGACGATVTVGASGVATTDSIAFSFNAAVGANPGVLNVHSWPTANNVNFVYCNPTAAGVTPSAATLNFRVTR